MLRWFLFGCLFFGLTVTGKAEEYVLYLEEIERIDQPLANKALQETIVRRVEVLVEPNKPFRLKMQAGKETIVFSGKIKPNEEKNKEAKEHYLIDVRYRWELDTGLKVLIAKDKWKPLPSIRGINTTLGLSLGQPVTAGEISTKNDEIGKHDVSDFRYLLVLKKHSSTAQP